MRYRILIEQTIVRRGWTEVEAPSDLAAHDIAEERGMQEQVKTKFHDMQVTIIKIEKVEEVQPDYGPAEEDK